MLALGGVLLAYTLVMVGSWTRIKGDGMTCPDWPLCRGAVVPGLHQQGRQTGGRGEHHILPHDNLPAGRSRLARACLPAAAAFSE